MPKIISRGLLNNTLVLQTVTETADGAGGFTQVWADGGSFKARISPLKASERVLQNNVGQFTTHRIYCDNMIVTPRDRIKWGDVYFEIIGITNPSEAYSHLEIDCREIFDESAGGI
jgi:SPP1 family predicted phage head-tail adaptor